MSKLESHQYEDIEEKDTALAVEDTSSFHLAVWNDDINTFDWVITSLMQICRHTAEQAEQCALFIHFKGKYAVKQGAFDKLRPMCTALLDRGISATIEAEVPS